MGGGHIAKAVSREHLLDEAGGGRGVEHQVDLWLGVGLAGKRIVQEVVENPAVELGGLGQVAPQPLRRIAGRAVLQTRGEPSELSVSGGQQMRLPVGEQLQPVLDGAKECVGPLENLALLVGEAARGGEPTDRIDRAAGPHLRRVTAIQELQELDRELNVADAPTAVLDVAGIDPFTHRPLLDPSLERLDARDVGPRQPAAVDPRGKLREQPLPQRLVAGHAAGLHPGLTLPRAAALIVILQHGIEAERRRSRRAVRPQPQVDAVGGTEVRGVADQPHGLLHDTIEELLVRAGLRPLHTAVGRMDEHEVDVAGIVELAPAELAECDRRDRRPLAAGPTRYAPLPFHARNRRGHGGLHDAVGHVGDLTDDSLQPLPAYEVAVGDAQRFPPLEPPQCPHHPVRVRRGARRRRPDLGRQRRCQRLFLLGPAFTEPDLLPRLGIGDHQFRKERAGREELHENAERPRIAVEERRSGQWVPHAADEPLDRHEHAIGVADLRQKLLQLAAHPREQVEREASLSEREQRAMGGGSVGEPRRRGPCCCRRRVVE